MLTRTIGAALIAIWRAPGIFFSLLDWLLVRVLAPLVGTTQKNTFVRYVWGASALGLAFLIGRYAGVHYAFWGLIFVSLQA